ncbi:MAG: sulfatase-like hydrolase/transferase, partial [Deltaproteobacteria bacterium]|nr:sulfatase-like hydrolase/transferase [Deltaproteobacteria bacterium]
MTEKASYYDIPQPINPDAKSVAPGNVTKHYTGDKPNILYIVLDDLGFSSLGSYGSEIQTPNIDRLAANGLRYNGFNVTPTSSPTRASLLTGRNSAAVGVGAVSAFDLGPEVPAYRGEITDAAATTAEVLKDEGYNTFMVGKWHLTPHNSDGPMGPFESWPLGKGFERFYGWLPGETNQFDPTLVVDNHHLETSPGN